MKILIIKFDGTKIEKDIRKFELRRNQVTCWYRLDNSETEFIDDVATIKIEE